MIIKNKRGAMEMSVGTIVTMVLMVTLLILGVVLIKNIFGSAKSIVDMTDEQLKNEVDKLFSEDDRVTIYPGTRFVEIKQEEIGGVGLGIQNLQPGSSGSNTFSYEVVVSDSAEDLEEKCGIAEETALGWIVVGKTGSGLTIKVGDSASEMIRFEIPTGAPLCTIRYRAIVKIDGEDYDSMSFDVKVKAK